MFRVPVHYDPQTEKSGLRSGVRCTKLSVSILSSGRREETGHLASVIFPARLPGDFCADARDTALPATANSSNFLVRG